MYVALGRKRMRIDWSLSHFDCCRIGSDRDRLPRRMCAMTDEISVKEAVQITGGHLGAKPWYTDDIVTVQGRKFIRLSKYDNNLLRFLEQRPSKVRNLARCKALQAIIDARDDELERPLGAAPTVAPCTLFEGMPTPEEGDGDEARAEHPRKRRRSYSPADGTRLMDVTVNGTQLTVLAMGGAASLYAEFTRDVFEFLFSFHSECGVAEKRSYTRADADLPAGMTFNRARGVFIVTTKDADGAKKTKTFKEEEKDAAIKFAVEYGAHDSPDDVHGET